MDSQLLMRIMLGDRCTANQFKGVFPANYFLNKDSAYPATYIVNTDSHNLPGKHWVAIYMTGNGHCEFFDSYGKPPQHYHPAWEDWIHHNSHTWSYNRQCIQPMFSATCGLHCLFYLYHRCLGMDAKTILKIYSTNLSLNDAMAEDLESHILEDIEIDDSAFIVNQICDASLRFTVMH